MTAHDHREYVGGVRLTLDSLTYDGEFVFVVEGDMSAVEQGMVIVVDPDNHNHRGTYRVTAVGDDTITAVPYRAEGEG